MHLSSPRVVAAEHHRTDVSIECVGRQNTGGGAQDFTGRSSAVHRATEPLRRLPLAIRVASEALGQAGRYNSTMTSLIVWRLSDAYSAVWDGLARECELSLEVVERADVAAVPEAIGIVAAGGVEESLPDVVRELTVAGVDVAAVGSLPDHRLAVATIRAGASEYFALPGDYDQLRRWIAERAERQRSRQNRTRFATAESAKYSFEGIQGASPLLQSALAQAARVIPHGNVTVLLTGETGTGKELLARAIHYQGPRREAPFVDVNCAAIPDQLLESELFGHEKGAFTGATSAKPGLFELANNGTVFLDEIGHLAMALQGKLLRALETRVIRRVGGQRAIPVDVRIVAATHVNLEDAVRSGQFRADLFHRLSVVPLELPPLRQREGDILVLARLFLAKLAKGYGMTPPRLASDAECALQRYPWPGNVRELRNAIERAMLLGEGGGTLHAEDFAFLKARSNDVSSSTNAGLPFPGTIQELVTSAAQQMVELCSGNKSEAARRLGISRPRLTRLLNPDASLTDLGVPDA